MIQVDQLTKRYGPVTAIQDVSFSVEKGQIVGFLGPNGAGKSTTMKILSCFMAASGGTARIAGFDVFAQSLEVRRRIGYLPENAPLYHDLPVSVYLDFVAEIKGVSRGSRKAIITRRSGNTRSHMGRAEVSEGFFSKSSFPDASKPHSCSNARV